MKSSSSKDAALKLVAWFTSGTGWAAVGRVTGALTITAVTFSLVGFAVFSVATAPLTNKLSQQVTQPTETTIAPSAPQPQRSPIGVVVGPPYLFETPTWGISGEPTIELPVLVENVSGEPYDLSPFGCFTATQGGKDLNQIIPAGGKVSPGGILPAGGVRTGWLYFEGVTPERPVMLSVQCAENQLPVTVTVSTRGVADK